MVCRILSVKSFQPAELISFPLSYPPLSSSLLSSLLSACLFNQFFYLWLEVERVAMVKERDAVPENFWGSLSTCLKGEDYFFPTSTPFKSKLCHAVSAQAAQAAHPSDSLCFMTNTESIRAWHTGSSETSAPWGEVNQSIGLCICIYACVCPRVLVT